MLHLTKGLTEDIYFTGAENATAINNWLIIFINRLTTENIVITNLSSNTGTLRYDKVSINVNTYFLNKTTGLYDYKIIDDDDNIVEKGLMYLHPSTNFAPTEYTEQVNTFVTYNGK